MLQLYWSIGKDLERIKENYNWGARFYSQVSKDIQAQLPDVKSFSQRNLLYMHQFIDCFLGEHLRPRLMRILKEMKLRPKLGRNLGKLLSQRFGISRGGLIRP